MTRKFWIAAGAYVIVTFVVAAGWHLALFRDLYTALGIFTRAEPIIALGLASMVLQALVVAWLYPAWYRGGSPGRAGARFGFALGLFMGSNAVLAEAGKNMVTSLPVWITLEGSYYLLQFTLVGAVIGWVYGPRDREAS